MRAWLQVHFVLFGMPTFSAYVEFATKVRQGKGKVGLENTRLEV